MPSAFPILAAWALCAVSAHGEDWLQWRGAQRDGVWRESGIIESIPPEGLKELWRVPIGAGFSSPVIAQNRVFVTDSLVTRTNAQENIRCLNADTGAAIWTYRYPVVYPEYGADPDHPFGPIATPVVAGGKIYTYGRMSHLFCLDAATGDVLWSHNLPKEIQATEDLRGPNTSPIVEGNLVVVAFAKSPQISMIAFDKDSGRQVWEALDEIPSNTSPIVADFAGRRQLVVWAHKSVAALEPGTGRILWRLNVPAPGNYAVPTPVWKNDLLLLSGLMLRLGRDEPSILWPVELRPAQFVLSDTSTPHFQDGIVVSATSKGALVCLDAASGKQLWQAENISESRSGASIHITAVPSIGRAFLFTDRGDLILAGLTARGFESFGRHHLLEPTAEFGSRKMAWVPPAYANKRILARNDKELVCASLAASPAR